MYKIFKELMTPENSQDWYKWAGNQSGHILIGAVLCSALLFGGVSWSVVIVPLAYALIKELHDIIRQGFSVAGLRDSLHDTLFVACGAGFIFGAWHQDIIIFAATVISGGAGIAFGVFQKSGKSK